MSIGYEKRGYYLININGGRRIDAKFGKMHIENGFPTCDAVGDNIAQMLYDIYGTSEQQFYFNGLVGVRLFYHYEYDNIYLCLYNSASPTTWNLVPARPTEYTWGRNCWCKRAGQVSGYNSAAFCPVGMHFCQMPNNPLIEGSDIFPFAFPATQNAQKVLSYVPVVTPYKQEYRNVSGQAAGTGYVGNFKMLNSATDWNVWNGRSPLYLLRNYHTQGYSDSGDIAKQQEYAAYGFPYGEDKKYVSVTGNSGQGEMQDTSTPIAVDDKPIMGISAFFNVWNMSYTNMSALRNLLVSDDFLDNLVTKLFDNAMDYITALYALPIASTNKINKNIFLGNLDTGIEAGNLQNYYEDIDMGSVAIPTFFDTYMDMHPYTKIALYLPFCSMVELNADYFVGDSVNVKYRVDMVTGQCIAFVSNSKGLITTATGNCAIQLPVRANDYSRVVSGFMGIIGSAAATSFGLATGNVTMAAGGAAALVGSVGAEAVAMKKPNVQTNGSYAGNTGALANRKPYLIIQRPKIAIPESYNKDIGYISRITAKLGDLHGLTVVEACHIDNVIATMEEKAEIERMLKNGIIL